jgi:hypothetical protein
MAGSNLDELCLFTVYHTSLARVAAFGVQGGLGLKRLMMLSRYESGIPKALGRGNLLRSFERHTCTITRKSKDTGRVGKPTGRGCGSNSSSFPASCSILRHFRLHIFRSVVLDSCSCLDYPQLPNSNSSFISTEIALNNQQISLWLLSSSALINDRLCAGPPSNQQRIAALAYRVLDLRSESNLGLQGDCS